ncbi:MAG: ATP-binding protein [Candidatus Latescibacterota bacterium]
MNDDLAQMLSNLQLNRMAEILDGEIAKARKGQVSYEDFLARLLRDQYHHRQERALASRIQKARIPEKWSLESFPYKQQPGVSQRQIKEFAELDFVSKAENIVFIGPTGVGKTGLATGILVKAIQNGYRGLFVRAQNLFDDMYASIADRSSRKLIDHLARIPVVLIDEVGFLNLKPEQTNIFFNSSYRAQCALLLASLTELEPPWRNGITASPRSSPRIWTTRTGRDSWVTRPSWKPS